VRRRQQTARSMLFCTSMPCNEDLQLVGRCRCHYYSPYIAVVCQQQLFSLQFTYYHLTARAGVAFMCALAQCAATTPVQTFVAAPARTSRRMQAIAVHVAQPVIQPVAFTARVAPAVGSAYPIPHAAGCMRRITMAGTIFAVMPNMGCRSISLHARRHVGLDVHVIAAHV
jgi:hypothetical protein